MTHCLPTEKLPGFEGPEKNLQIVFKSSQSSIDKKEKKGLRTVSRERWQSILDNTACTIISERSNDCMTAYILSESSCFVYEDRVVLKTCGTTRLLCALGPVLALGTSLGLTPACVLFWRKAYSYPEKQLPPHSSFEQEVAYLDTHLNGYHGKTYTARSAIVDHCPDLWCVYLSVLTEHAERLIHPTTEAKLHEIKPELAQCFMDTHRESAQSKATQQMVRHFVPNLNVDEFFFDPCGYSMNGIGSFGTAYSTVHITPEAHCSYASFETTSDTVNPHELANKVSAIMCPCTFTLMVLNVCGHSHSSVPITVNGYQNTLCSSMSLGELVFSVYAYEITQAHPLSYYTQLRCATAEHNFRGNDELVKAKLIAQQGSALQAIVELINGEEIDIVPYKFYSNSFT